MPRLRFTSEAYRDLDQIIGFIGSQDPVAATHLIKQLESKCRGLAQNPGIAQARPDLAAGLRFFPVGKYLLFYRQEIDGIQVIRVIHGSRDYRQSDL